MVSVSALDLVTGMSRSELPTVTWHSSGQPRCVTRSHYPIYIRSWVGYGDLQIFFRCLCEFRFASDPPQQAFSAADNIKSDKQPGKYSVVYINITSLGRKADVLSLYNSLLRSRNNSRSYQIPFLLQPEPIYIQGWGILHPRALFLLCCSWRLPWLMKTAMTDILKTDWLKVPHLSVTQRL